jgi:hypothetical protein
MEKFMPNLSNLADNEFSLGDLDDIIEKESSNFNSNQIQNIKEDNNTNTSIYRPSEDPFQKEMLSIIDEDINNSQVNENLIPNDNQKSTQTQVDNYYENSNNNENIDPYVTAFDLIQEMDLLRLPDGIQALSPEEINFYKEQTLIQQRDEALDYLRSQASHDPYMLEIFDYVMMGKNFADLQTFKALTNVEIDYETLNVNDEDTQRELIRQYLSSDLNPNNKKDRELLSYIPEKIEKLYESGDLKNKALEARDHFITRIKEQKNLEFQAAVNRREQFEYEQWLQQQEQIQWDKEFRETLYQRKWSDVKKHNVVKENQTIQLEDGSRVPLWEYKRQIIFSDPYLFQQFLDFTSKLDLNQGDFIGLEYSDEPDLSSSTINKILERAVQKSQTAKNTSTSNRPQFEKKESKNVADPNQWF